jgi:hypothetical protein
MVGDQESTIRGEDLISAYKIYYISGRGRFDGIPGVKDDG